MWVAIIWINGSIVIRPLGKWWPSGAHLNIKMPPSQSGDRFIFNIGILIHGKVILICFEKYRHVWSCTGGQYNSQLSVRICGPTLHKISQMKTLDHIFMNWSTPGAAFYDYVIKWNYFPRYWPFVQGIHRSPVNSPHKGLWRGALIFPLMCSNKRLSKQS